MSGRQKRGIILDCYFDKSLTEGFRSHPQMVRVLTESWVEAHMYCVRCGSERLVHCPNNRAVADFYCPVCGNEYELKSKNGPIGRKINDGAYETFIERITSNSNPDFFIMSYDREQLCVDNFWVIPRHFFVPAIVEKRKPLGEGAKRAGWVGCNILIDEVPRQGRIPIICHGESRDREQVRAAMRRADALYTADLSARGWLLDVLHCVNRVEEEEFSLAQVYAYEAELARKHPDNKHICPKIRQQLQVLRDKGVIEFLGRGLYRKCGAQEE